MFRHLPCLKTRTFVRRLVRWRRRLRSLSIKRDRGSDALLLVNMSHSSRLFYAAGTGRWQQAAVGTSRVLSHSRLQCTDITVATGITSATTPVVITPILDSTVVRHWIQSILKFQLFVPCDRFLADYLNINMPRTSRSQESELLAPAKLC